MAQGQLDIGVVLNGFGFANEQLGAIQSRVESLRDTLSTHGKTIAGIKLIPEAERSKDEVQRLEGAVSALKGSIGSLAQTTGTVMVDALNRFSKANREVAIEFEQMTVALRRFREEGQSAKDVLGDIIQLSKLPMVDLRTAMKSFVALRFIG